MLTARDEEPDRVAGLEVGADDYVAEAVLAARARRAHEGDPAPRRAGAAATQVLELGDVVLDLEAREVDGRRASRSS